MLVMDDGWFGKRNNDQNSGKRGQLKGRATYAG